MANVILRPEKQGTFLARHPWVLAKSIQSGDPRPNDGDVVDLVLPNGRWIARGLYNGRSRIHVRLYTWLQQESLDDPFWLRRLDSALALRAQLGLLGPQQAARIVYSEADGLSGLIIDRYGPHVVIQLTALAMEDRLSLVREWLQERLAPATIVLRVDPRVARAEGMEAMETALVGEPPASAVTLEEHGLRMEFDFVGGQKTGYYLDQRDNRLQAAHYLQGRHVLDVCCYVGGFGLMAVGRGGALSSLGIDGSQKALDQAARNAELNGLATRVNFLKGDCFEVLEEFGNEGRRFGGVILDPPRFAADRRSIDAALRAYHRLNRLAVEVLEPEGILVTCSCSGLVTRDDFRRMLVGVTHKSGRSLQVLEDRGAAPDHPVLLSCPESEYLKCLIVRVH